MKKLFYILLLSGALVACGRGDDRKGPEDYSDKGTSEEKFDEADQTDGDYPRSENPDAAIQTDTSLLNPPAGDSVQDTRGQNQQGQQNQQR